MKLTLLRYMEDVWLIKLIINVKGIKEKIAVVEGWILYVGRTKFNCFQIELKFLEYRCKC